MSTGIRHVFKAQYIIDCTGTGNIAKLAGAPETGIDLVQRLRILTMKPFSTESLHF